jgi:hypothetical protein
LNGDNSVSTNTAAFQKLDVKLESTDEKVEEKEEEKMEEAL